MPEAPKVHQPRRARRPQGPPDSPSPSNLQTASHDKETSEPELVDIGNGRRWYDLPYRTLHRIQYSSLGKRLPTRWYTRLHATTNFLYQTHTAKWFEKERIGSRWGTIELPQGEAVNVPALWVAEYFTASQVGKLYTALHRHGWDGARFIGDPPGGSDSLHSSRAGQGASWWRIADLRPRNSRPGLSMFAAHRAKLPPGVQYVDLIGISVGKGITAVVAGFYLDEQRSQYLNQHLHSSHQPSVIRRPGQLASAQEPKFVLYNRVQKARSDMHREMRSWMANTLPGVFARSKWNQPLFELALFDVANPHSDADHQLRDNDALRAIGIIEYDYQFITSADLPGLLLELPPRTSMVPDLSPNAWTIWGNQESTSTLSRGSSIGHHVGSVMTDYIARSGLTELLRLLRGEASVAHDNARKLHGGNRSRNLRRLRDRLLTTSLDLATLQNDIHEYNDRLWRDREPHFVLNVSPAVKKRESAMGRQYKSISLNKQERKLQKQLARELIAFDTDYREVLSTVASLGASLDSRRVQRLATSVSIVSLIVAAVTLWVTSDSSDLIKDIQVLLNIG
jgi:hypothetical protein